MKKIRVGVIGGGFIGQVHIEALRRLHNAGTSSLSGAGHTVNSHENTASAEIAAVCDPVSPDLLAARYGIERYFSDYRNILDMPGIDSVHICTPNDTHYDIARAALERGIAVVCEKPFTMTIGQAEELTRLAEEKKVPNMVNFHNRFYPAARHMRDILSRGEIGTVFAVHGGYMQDYLLHDKDFNWRVSSAKGGRTRVVGDIGSHWMDLAEYVTGLRIRRIMSQFKRQYPERYAYDGSKVSVDTEDMANLLVEFENGAIGQAYFTQMEAGSKNKLEISIAGTKASCRWDSEDVQNLYIGQRNAPNLIITKDPELMEGEAGGMIAYPAGHAEGFADAIKQAFHDFYGHYANGEGSYADFRDGLHSMRLCEAAYLSAQSGAWCGIG